MTSRRPLDPMRLYLSWPQAAPWLIGAASSAAADANAVDVAVARAILEADAVINLPRLKTHPLTGYTMAVKNLMGALRNPYAFHKSGDAKLPLYIAALGAALRPHITLNIVDATDLVRGWAAGKPGRLTRIDTIIAAPDLFAADAVAVTLFGDDPLAHWKCPCGDSYLRIAHAEGLTTADPSKLNTKHIELSEVR